MKSNVGSADKVIRFILGAAIILIGFIFKSWWGVVGVIVILTAVLNFCPLYALIGFSTKPKVEKQK
jgi:hypothetical protein